MGIKEGETDGPALRNTLGQYDGISVSPLIEGATVGVKVETLSTELGNADERMDGGNDGEALGIKDGGKDGEALGVKDGRNDGATLGNPEGIQEG